MGLLLRQRGNSAKSACSGGHAERKLCVCLFVVGNNCYKSNEALNYE